MTPSSPLAHIIAKDTGDEIAAGPHFLPDASRSMKATSVPFFNSFASRSTSQLVSRTQPCDSDLLTLDGIRRAVDAIALPPKGRSNAMPAGLLGPGLIDERLFGFDALELVVRIVAVRRICASIEVTLSAPLGVGFSSLPTLAG